MASPKKSKKSFAKYLADKNIQDEFIWLIIALFGWIAWADIVLPDWFFVQQDDGIPLVAYVFAPVIILGTITVIGLVRIWQKIKDE